MKPGDALRYKSRVDLSEENNTHTQQLKLIGTDKRVLEIGTASGYVSSALEAAGCRVTGIELDPVAAEYASEFCVRMIVGNVEELNLREELEGELFDTIVLGDVLEHLANPVELIRRLTPFLAEDGCLVASVPNVAHGSVRLSLLGGRFDYQDMGLLDRTHLRFFTRKTIEELFNAAGCSIDQWRSILVDPLETELLLREEDLPDLLVYAVRDDPEANVYQYVVRAVKSDSNTSEDGEKGRAHRLKESNAIVALPKSIAQRDREISRLNEVIEERQRSFERELAEVQQLLQVARQESEERAAVIASKEAQFTTYTGRMQSELASMGSDREHALQALEEVHGSLAWRGLAVYRKILRRIPFAGAAYSACRRMVGRLLSAGGPEAHREPELTQPALPEMVLPSFAEPEVSIVIPAHNNLEATGRCLESILRNTEGVTYEVIVVDDASSDATGEFVSAVRNLKVITHSSPLGYLRATNAGAEAAQGHYLVLLNNDTEVRPNWINALLVPVRADEKVAVVGAKLLYPDLTLQEAGGIVWSDADACNYGRGDDPGACQYNYLREVDYCSAACLLVRREVFEELGRFDVRFAPAYYEDTDLAFAARERGYKVVYQPKAEVIHDEGTSSGTDIESGMKRFQAVNRVKFAEKWGSVLESQPTAGGSLLRARERPTADRLLIVDAAVPTFDHDSGSLRMNSLLLNLVERGFAVTFLPDNRDPRQPYTSLLQAAGVEILYGDYDLGEWLRAMAPELRMCLASRPSVAWRYLAMVREYAPECRFVFDTVDLHYLREQRRADWEGKDWLWRLAEGYKQLELGLVRAADAAVTVTDRERDLLLGEVPDASVHVIPNIHQVRSATRSFADRRDLVFVGGFNHPPNGAAVEYFIREVFPKVKKQLPDITFHVVGSYPPPEIKELEAPDIRVTGYVADLNPYIQGCRLSVAPLTYGAGLKGKITQALSEGLPVVTTSIGAEGTDLVHGENALIADEPEAFAREVVRAYTDEQLWSSLAKEGLAHAEQNYSSSAVSRLLDGLLEELKILN